MKKHLLLCGLPCSGKTTVGKRLASLLAWPFVDIDALIEAAYKRKKKALFTFTGRISVEREASDGAVDDEAIALAIAEEANAPDERLAADRKLTENVNKADKSMSCREIFTCEGEGFFRFLERKVISSLVFLSCPSVIALGGGSLCCPDNRSLVTSLGYLIYLKINPLLLWQRLQQQPLPAYLDPLFPEQAFFALAASRIPFYEKSAHAILTTDNLSEEDIAKALKEQYMAWEML